MFKVDEEMRSSLARSRCAERAVRRKKSYAITPHSQLASMVRARSDS
jgi:hypothetical protein